MTHAKSFKGKVAYTTSTNQTQKEKIINLYAIFFEDFFQEYE
jgi:hypothetical protein